MSGKSDEELTEEMLEEADPEYRPTAAEQEARARKINEACSRAHDAAWEVLSAVREAENAMRWDPVAAALALDEAEKNLKKLRKRIEEVRKL